MPRDAKLRTQTQMDGCLVHRKPGLAAPPLTLEMPWSSFPAEAAARTFPIPLLPSWTRLGPCWLLRLAFSPLPDPCRQPPPTPSPSQAWLALPLQIAQAGGMALRCGKLGREAGAQRRCSLLPPQVRSSPPHQPRPTGSFGPCGPPQLSGVLHVAPTTRGRRASTHRIAFGASRCCVDAAALWVARTGTSRPAGSALSAAG